MVFGISCQEGLYIWSPSPHVVVFALGGIYMWMIFMFGGNSHPTTSYYDQITIFGVFQSPHAPFEKKMFGPGAVSAR